MDLPVVADGDLGVDGQAAADFAVGGVQRPGVLREQSGRVAGQAEAGQDVTAGRRPRRAFQEAPSGSVPGRMLPVLTFWLAAADVTGQRAAP